MRFYVAASYSRIEEAKSLTAQLVKRGHKCTAHWIAGQHQDRSPEKLAEYAAQDIADINHAGVFIMLTGDDPSQHYTGGRHTELGYAYAKNKTIMAVGPREKNVFHCLKDIRWFNTIDALIWYVDGDRKRLVNIDV